MQKCSAYVACDGESSKDTQYAEKKEEKNKNNKYINVNIFLERFGRVQLKTALL